MEGKHLVEFTGVLILSASDKIQNYNCLCCRPCLELLTRVCDHIQCLKYLIKTTGNLHTQI